MIFQIIVVTVKTKLRGWFRQQSFDFTAMRFVACRAITVDHRPVNDMLFFGNQSDVAADAKGIGGKLQQRLVFRLVRVVAVRTYAGGYRCVLMKVLGTDGTGADREHIQHIS